MSARSRLFARLCRAALPGLAAIWLAACGATVEPPPPVFLKAAGSTTMAPLVTQLAEAYHQRQPRVTIDVDGGGSQHGAALARGRQVELGLVSQPPADLPPNLRAVTIARDGIAVVVHPETAISNLTLLELRELFAGRFLDWREVGEGTARGEIQLVSREDGSGTRAAFEARLAAGGELRVSPTAVVMPNSQAVVDFVASHPGAVGYVSSALVTEAQQVRVVAVEGVVPRPATISSGEYPLSRELQVLIQADAPAEVRAFLDFVLSPAGQAIVAERYGRVR